ncbi:hypothetical protein MT418_003732 [Batrachochytrium dendrobatidis]
MLESVYTGFQIGDLFRIMLASMLIPLPIHVTAHSISKSRGITTTSTRFGRRSTASRIIPRTLATNTKTQSTASPTHLSVSGSPVYFYGTSNGGYGVISYVPICAAGQSGIIISTTSGTIMPSSNAPPNPRAAFCAANSTTGARFKGIGLDESSNQLYILYNGSLGQSVSLVNTTTMDVLYTGKIDSQIGECTSIAVAKHDTIPTSIVILSSARGLWITPTKSFESGAYTQLSQFLADQTPVDIASSNNYVYIVGTVARLNGYFIKQINVADSSSITLDLEILTTRFLETYRYLADKAQMTRKPIQVCNSIVYMFMVDINGQGLAIRSYTQQPFQMLGQNSLLIPSADTVVSISCASSSTTFNDASFSGISVLVQPADQKELYIINVDKETRASFKKTVSIGSKLDSQNSVNESVSTIGLATQSTTFSMGLLRIANSVVNTWVVDLVNGSYLADITPNKTNCDTGHFFYPSKNACVLCTEFEHPPSFCLKPQLQRSVADSGPSGFKSLSIPVRVLIIIGVLLLACLIIGLALKYLIYYKKTLEPREQLLDSNLKAISCQTVDSLSQSESTSFNTDSPGKETYVAVELNGVLGLSESKEAGNKSESDQESLNRYAMDESVPPVLRVKTFGAYDFLTADLDASIDTLTKKAIEMGMKVETADMRSSCIALGSIDGFLQKRVSISTVDPDRSIHSVYVEQDSAHVSPLDVSVLNSPIKSSDNCEMHNDTCCCFSKPLPLKSCPHSTPFSTDMESETANQNHTHVLDIASANQDSNLAHADHYSNTLNARSTTSINDDNNHTLESSIVSQLPLDNLCQNKSSLLSGGHDTQCVERSSYETHISQKSRGRSFSENNELIRPAYATTDDDVPVTSLKSIKRLSSQVDIESKCDSDKTPILINSDPQHSLKPRHMKTVWRRSQSFQSLRRTDVQGRFHGHIIKTAPKNAIFTLRSTNIESNSISSPSESMLSSNQLLTNRMTASRIFSDYTDTDDEHHSPRVYARLMRSCSFGPLNLGEHSDESYH